MYWQSSLKFECVIIIARGRMYINDETASRRDYSSGPTCMNPLLISVMGEYIIINCKKAMHIYVQCTIVKFSG